MAQITNDEVCSATWNPGEWPYITRCVLRANHGEHQHRDRKGRAPTVRVYMTENVHEAMMRSQAADAVVTILTSPDHRGPTLHRDKTRTLAMVWPTLAAALAGLVQAHDKDVPSALRRALAIITENESPGRGRGLTLSPLPMSGDDHD